MVGRKLKILADIVNESSFGQGYSAQGVNAISSNIDISYIRKPNHVSWGYVVVGGNAMYDPTNTSNFELHASDEGEIVNRITAFAGISMQKQELFANIASMESGRTQQEKS